MDSVDCVMDKLTEFYSSNKYSFEEIIECNESLIKQLQEANELLEAAIEE